jgi:hypothetical protein
MSAPIIEAANVSKRFGSGATAVQALRDVLDHDPFEHGGSGAGRGARHRAVVRITGNRVGQVLVPFVASLIAVAAGTAGILLVIAFTLAASGTAVRMSARRG